MGHFKYLTGQFNHTMFVVLTLALFLALALTLNLTLARALDTTYA